MYNYMSSYWYGESPKEEENKEQSAELNNKTGKFEIEKGDEMN